MYRLIFRLLHLLPVLGLLFTASCGVFGPDEPVTDVPDTQTLELTPGTVVATSPVLPADETPHPGDAGPLTLRIWVPPQFDPYDGTPAGELLRLRLADFETRYPGMHLDVRVKAVDGPGGLLDSLSTASSAAPEAAPDLVALSNTTMVAAALKGLLHPYEGLSQAVDNPDWFPYAAQMGNLQGSTFGLPFAGNSLVLLYDVTLGSPPTNIDTFLETSTIVAFPVTDPQALLTLDVYLASGGVVQDDDGRPEMDAATLEKILSFYQSANQSHIFAPKIETPMQALDAFQQESAEYAVVWASDALNSADLPENSALTVVPNFSDTPFSLATGWVWGLSSSQPERQAYAVELGEFLTDPEFLAGWSRAAGYLPVQNSGLSAWHGSPHLAAVTQVCTSAVLIPSADLLASISPALHQAALDVLSDQFDARAAAEKAAAGVQ